MEATKWEEETDTAPVFGSNLVPGLTSSFYSTPGLTVSSILITITTVTNYTHKIKISV